MDLESLDDAVSRECLELHGLIFLATSAAAKDALFHMIPVKMIVSQIPKGVGQVSESVISCQFFLGALLSTNIFVQCQTLFEKGNLFCVS